MQRATKVFNRLSENEKIRLRVAGPDRLAYLARADFLVDLVELPHEEATLILTEVQALCHLQFKHRSTLAFGVPG